MSGKRILVIDDDRSLLRLVQIILGRRGNHVEVALSVREAEQLLQSLPAFDMVILDLMMPNENGFAFLEWQEKQDPPLRDVPVILNTAKQLTPDEQEYLDRRCWKIIIKGINFTERLLSEVESSPAG
jgi:CheY-like chemotaxis protein